VAHVRHGRAAGTSRNSGGVGMTDVITIIRARHMLMAKRVHTDGQIQDYDRAKTFDLFERPVTDLEDLRKLVAEIIP
jgi:hypothetical protein